MRIQLDGGFPIWRDACCFSDVTTGGVMIRCQFCLLVNLHAVVKFEYTYIPNSVLSDQLHLQSPNRVQRATIGLGKCRK